MTLQNKGIKFDATINLGHIMTFVGFILSGAVMYSNLDKRVVSLEVSKIALTQALTRQQELMDENRKIMREDIKSIDSKLDRLIERSEVRK